MSSTALFALSPLDGRYASKTQALCPFFSEAALMKYRARVEMTWLSVLNQAKLADFPVVSNVALATLTQRVLGFTDQDAQRIKTIEATTSHDVKALEYWLKELVVVLPATQPLKEWVHFACTSEDINNLAYALMVKESVQGVVIPKFEAILSELKTIAHEQAQTPMLARTHGQTASPTTLGKEFANVAARLERAIGLIRSVEILGKINGAVGNFNAHAISYPQTDWQALSEQTVEALGLTYNAYTTQIEPHDWMATLFDAIARAQTILIDFVRDVWGYISLGYFSQKLKEGEVGSSTMPHKVNPIDFENAEGNFGVSNALLRHFAEKLPISRWQRDLTDSTVLRNVGSAFGYTVLALSSLQNGMGKLQVNHARLSHDLDTSWEVLAEAIQTVMRRYALPNPYEQLKALTRGQQGITRESLSDFIDQLDIPNEAKERLQNLTPATYVGLASELALKV
jgi:adenylosuccinate lyase